MLGNHEILLILGHGSSKHPDSSQSVRSHAELLAEKSNFAEVRVAFLKEEPFIDDCLKGIDSDRVIIVPDFLAEGYFTRQVIPKKLGSIGRNENVIYCPPVGTHPMMASVIEDAAQQLLGDWLACQTELFVVGHGSGKNPCSKQTLLHHLEKIRALNTWAKVQDLWLEERPRVGDWQSLAKARQIVVVPYLLNDGQHGGWDIPTDLGVKRGAVVHGVTHEMGDHRMRIARAAGSSPRFAEVIDLLASLWASK
ncbi:MAG: CbiX/SirB N-terminal domain-containing protein [Akkermansiaceae bacterium]